MNFSPIRTFGITAIILLCGLNISAQESRFNNVSLELTTGVHVPLSPANNISRTKYIAFKQFQLAGRYMFNQKFGLKAHFAHNTFGNPDDSKMNLKMNRLGLEAVANIGELLNVDYRIRERYGLLFHTGFGLTLAQPSTVKGSDKLANVLAGFTGEIKLNDRFTLLGDMTYVGSFKQNYGYNGALINANGADESGGFVNVSVGIMYSLGSQKYHADWY